MMARNAATKVGLLFLSIGLLSCASTTSNASCDGVQAGVPLGFIAGWIVDLNADSEEDKVLLLDDNGTREIIALLRDGTSYKPYVLMRSEEAGLMSLSCVYGDTVYETVAGEGDTTSPTVHTTNGVYIQASQPEGASVVYYWDGTQFVEVWVSD